MLIVWCTTGFRDRPQIFIMYTRAIGVIARKHGVKFHLYADDTQLYATFDVNDEASFTSSLQTLEYCIVWYVASVRYLK